MKKEIKSREGKKIIESILKKKKKKKLMNI